jgi:O-antigen/teichoic acid export membrane protein
LGIDRTVQNVTGPESYGIYFSLFNFSLLFQVLLDFGFNNFNNRYIARHPEQLGRYFSTMIVAKLIFAFAYALVAWAVAIGIGFDQESPAVAGAYFGESGITVIFHLFAQQYCRPPPVSQRCMALCIR